MDQESTISSDRISTPRDWVQELTRRARGERVELAPEEARRLALVLCGLAATVEQLESYVQRLGDQARAS